MKRHIQADAFLSDYERCVKHAYRGEIDALLRGPLFLLADNESERKKRITDLLMSEYAATVPYVDKVLSYSARNAPVFLIIDNVDQFEDQDKQAEIFADALAVAHKMKLNLILALRDATYVRNRTQPVFDAFDFDPIYIDAPQVGAVLSRRFFIAKQSLKDVPLTFTAENKATVHLQDSSIIIDLVQASVLGTEVGNLLEVLATSDIRLALRMTREFLQYGYTATGRALQIYQSTGKYMLPRHEALRAVMLGNQSVYADEYSVLGNPFDAKLGRTKAQLLRL